MDLTLNKTLLVGCDVKEKYICRFAKDMIKTTQFTTRCRKGYQTLITKCLIHSNSGHVDSKRNVYLGTL